MSENTIPEQAPARSKAAKWIACGCVTAVVLAVAGVLIAFVAAKYLVTGMIEKYTSPHPRALPVSTMSEQDAGAVCARVDAFQAALRDGRAAGPLDLTGDDINALFRYHAGWTNWSGKVHVSIAGGKIRVEASIPIDAISKKNAGRYLNGTGTIIVLLTDGRLLVFLDDLEVNGKPAPEYFMKSFRSQNLAKDVNENEKTAALLARFESIKVEGGRLRITPKTAP